MCLSYKVYKLIGLKKLQGYGVWRGCANKLTLLALAAMRCDLDVIVSRLADLKVPKDTRLKKHISGRFDVYCKLWMIILDKLSR